MEIEAPIDTRSLDLAHQLALTELIRFLLIEIASNDDGVAFRKRLRKIEEGVVTSLSSRRHYPTIGEPDEAINSRSRERLRHTTDRVDPGAGHRKMTVEVNRTPQALFNLRILRRLIFASAALFRI
jgi:hypothetical protein